MSRGRRSLRWWTAIIVIPAALWATIVLTPLVLAGNLPDPMATAWSAGAPSGSAALWVAVVVPAWMFLPVWAAAAYMARHGLPAKEVLAGTYAVGVALAAGQVTVAIANSGASEWARAADVGSAPLVVYALSAAAALSGWVVAGPTVGAE